MRLRNASSTPNLFRGPYRAPNVYIYILVATRAYPGTQVRLMDQGGCELRGVDGTFRILIRIMLELELDRSMWSSKSANLIHPRAKSPFSS